MLLIFNESFILSLFCNTNNYITPNLYIQTAKTKHRAWQNDSAKGLPPTEISTPPAQSKKIDEIALKYALKDCNFVENFHPYGEQFEKLWKSCTKTIISSS